jgi:YidC/Oxa1 family membrane protein insertase
MFKDKNTVIGFALLAMLFFAYFFITSKQSKDAQMAKEIEQRKIDSIAKTKLPKLTAADTVALKNDSIKDAQNKALQSAGGFKGFATGVETFSTLENELVKIELSNKGGRPAKIMLKKHMNSKGQQVQLLGDSADAFGYTIQSGANTTANTDALYFTANSVVKNSNGSSTIAFEIKDSSGKNIVHSYTLQPNSYVLDMAIKLQGANQLVTANTLNFTNSTMVQQQDNDKSYEAQSSQFVYLKDGDYDFYDATSTRDFNIDKPIQWFGYKQRFFSTLLLGKEPFKNAKVVITTQADSSSKLYLAKTNIQMPLNANGEVNMQLYAGPNDYPIVSNLGNGTKNIVQLHSRPFGFVKWINRGVVMPVFNWLLKNVGSVGLAIALLTLFIRLITAPLMMPGYLTSAKMKILRPELDVLKAKFGDDQQGFALEQMKYLKQAGVNQFAGCLPSLLQIPIFFALFALFTAHIGVRGESFLWAKDLSMYDNAIHFTNLPIIGNHISIFALTASITSFLISWYSMSMTPDQGNPVLKYMPYFFPIIMFFIFNNLPSALNWYYTVSNVIALIIQVLIQRVFLNHDKLKAQMEITKKTVKPKSKFQERYEQMMEMQRKAQQNKK